MGSSPQNMTVIKLKLFERARRKERRRAPELLLSVNQRSSILLRAGYSVTEIVSAASNAKAIRLQRLESLQEYKSSTRGTGRFGSIRDLLVANITKENVSGVQKKVTRVFSIAYDKTLGSQTPTRAVRSNYIPLRNL